jgi:hypothetical protein
LPLRCRRFQRQPLSPLAQVWPISLPIPEIHSNKIRYLCQGRRDGGGTYRNRPGCLVYQLNSDNPLFPSVKNIPEKIPLKKSKLRIDTYTRYVYPAFRVEVGAGKRSEFGFKFFWYKQRKKSNIGVA